MADNIPFGLTFGNPSKYMGQNPGLVEAGKALKTGAAIWGLQKSGLIGVLDSMGVKQNQSGGFSYNTPSASGSPAGSIPPITSGAAGDMNTNGVWGTNPLPVQPPNFGGQDSAAAPEVNPNAGAFTQQAQDQLKLNNSMIPNQNGMAGAVAPGVQTFPVPDQTPPANTGRQILEGNDDWQHSAVNPQAQRDSLVLPQQQTAEVPRLTGNEYQQAPGYGSAKKMAMAMFGLG